MTVKRHFLISIRIVLSYILYVNLLTVSFQLLNWTIFYFSNFYQVYVSRLTMTWEKYQKKLLIYEGTGIL